MQPRSSEGFPKALRLRSRREFLEVQGHGVKVQAGDVLCLAQKNDRAFTRLGLTVSSKVGNAVVRAQLRRRLRELFRKRRGQLPGGLDLVLIARPGAARRDFDALSRSFDQIASKLQGLFP